jgi:3-oxoacyl-[acyl-carrier-protein] synthase-3
MRDLRITGLATYAPRRTLDNRALLERHPTLTLDDAERVGVLTRGDAADDEDVTAMAVAAAKDALERAETSAADLDFVVLAHWSERRHVPDVAPRVQARLGASRAFAFDIGCACAGFIVGLSLAHGYLQNSRWCRGLVVASDRSRRLMRPTNRAALLFGDGAAAAVVTSGVEHGYRLVDYELSTDGGRNDLMDVDAEGFLASHVRQRDLNELAVTSLIRAGRALLARQGLGFGDVDFIVPHSGTAGIQRVLAEALELPRGRILTNLVMVGNLAAASIPTSLAHFVASGTLRRGHRVLTLAVGLGWQSVAALIEL